MNKNIITIVTSLCIGLFCIGGLTGYLVTDLTGQDYDSLLLDFQKLNEEYSDLSGDYNELQDNYTELQTKYDILVEDNNSLTEIYNELLNDYNLLELAYQEILNNYNSLIITYNELVSENIGLQSDFDILLIDYIALEDSYYLLSYNYNNLIAEHDILINDYELLEIEINLLTETYNQLLIDYNELTESLVTLQNNFDDLQIDYNVLLVSYNMLLETLITLQNDHDNLQVNYDILLVTYNALMETLIILQNNFDDLQIDYDLLFIAYNQLDNLYSQLESNYLLLQAEYNLLSQQWNQLSIWIRGMTLPAQYLVFAEAVRRYYFEDYYMSLAVDSSTYWYQFARFCRDIVLHDSRSSPLFQGSRFSEVSNALADCLCSVFGSDTESLAQEIFYSVFYPWLPTWSLGRLSHIDLVDINTAIQWCIDEIDYEYDIDITYRQEAGYFDYVKFPVETAFRTLGDCEDQALLISAYLESNGFETALAIFHDSDNPNFAGGFYHATSLVQIEDRVAFWNLYPTCNLWTFDDGATWWCWIDTTWDVPFGSMPSWMPYYITNGLNSDDVTIAICDLNGMITL